jgi:peptide-methionine (S)-S-oxide reductase
MAGLKTAIFAGGCFWCMEKPFDQREGVTGVVSGYAGGQTKNPTYESTSAGDTGHREVIQVTYDPDKISYQSLLDIFWRNIDPFDAGGQQYDRGEQYTTAVFVGDDEERRIAENSKAALEKRFGQAIATKILPAADFYSAEAYHQGYYKTNEARYCAYREGSGRDQHLKKIWGEDAGG